MPFIRNSKGVKVPFSSTKLSALVSSIYIDAMGSVRVAKFRPEIQKICIDLYTDLSEIYGSDESSEWPSQIIRTALEKILRSRAPLEVYEAFMSTKINELAENQNIVGNIKKSVVFTDNDKIDPIWAISSLPIINEDTVISSDSDVKDIINIGFPAGADYAKKKPKTTEPRTQRRSDWLLMFKSISQLDRFLWSSWESHVLALPVEQSIKTPAAWWSFWMDQISIAMLSDPRLYELKRSMFDHYARARNQNQLWLSGTPLYSQQLILERTHSGNAKYAHAATDHLKNIFSDYEFLNWDLIRRAIKPERDLDLSWHALQDMEESECLWSIGNSQAKELPQWSFMRFAISMAIKSPEKNIATDDAISVYDRISRMSLIPSSSAIREAGLKKPRFMEDSSVRVRDNFESIQDAVYSSAINTKWTGTYATDWSELRAKGSDIKNGRRQSAGPSGFIRAIDSNLRAQGRSDDDRPATVILPAWHMDVEEFSRSRLEDADRLQVVISVPDLLMSRVSENGTWTLFDPAVYPEVISGSSGILIAESLIKERKKLFPKSHKECSAERIWKKIISQSKLGSPFIVFPESDKSFSSFPELTHINGLDGVGTFPIQDSSLDISWPAIAINLSSLISDSGEPMLDDMRETLTWAYWIAERMYDWSDDYISENTKNTRPLCLGAIGFYEAVSKASFGVDYDPDMISLWVSKISESWSTLAVVVDQIFCQKFGPAPIWNSNLKKQVFNPVKMMTSLKKARNGSLGSPLPEDNVSEIFNTINSHRFTTRLLWAPFRQASIWANVSPGGFGTLFPVEWVVDEAGIYRVTPTSFLMNAIGQDVQNAKSFGSVLANPSNPLSWPESLRKLSQPDSKEWRVRLQHAALVRPWVDQGVSVTLPSGLTVDQTSMLARQVWWMGLSGVRFEDPFKRPPVQSKKPDEND